jgi:diaminohydroxyphosphoribosylaminopyrimidine deaminase/5-amino-6-(5-phosphoribosylamino)uracil reductase
MDYMARALELADRAKGFCNPNPAVGAVLVRDGRIVGEGYTQPRGQAHAEVMALRQAGPDADGATLYVTLEPCCHQGMTGPCTDQIIASGVREVHCSMLDPSPWVNGQGRAALEKNRIPVAVGAGESAARHLNEDYLFWIRAGRPFVTAKYAMTLDGKTATRTGSSRWVSGTESRSLVGQMRSQVDALMVGVGTVLADDPSLTARAADESLLSRQPLRVVLDSQGRLPWSARVANGCLPGRTLLATTPAGREVLDPRVLDSVDVWVGDPAADGHVNLPQLLAELGRRNLISLLLESGGTLLAALLEQRLVDAVAAFIAPKIVGGASALTPVEGIGIDDMASAIDLVDVTYEQVGGDILVRGYLRPCSQAS